MSHISAELRRFVVDNFLFGQNGAALTDDTSLVDGGILDSTGVLELVQFLERRFEIRVEDDEIVPENLDSLERLANFVQRKLAVCGEAA